MIACLTVLLRTIPAVPLADASALRDLLPDRWAAAHPQHVLQARQQESRAAWESPRLHRAQRRAALPA